MMLQTEIAYLALGSNIGDREYYLKSALDRLHRTSNCRVVRLSNIYETDPVGLTNQASFLNMAAAIETSLPPYSLFEHMKEVEEVLGRTREVRWGPRTIDLDLLLFGKWTSHDQDLQVPHPRMEERSFVLIPLSDVLRETDQPFWKDKVTRLCEQHGKDNGVRVWKSIQWLNEFVPSES